MCRAPLAQYISTDSYNTQPAPSKPSATQGKVHQAFLFRAALEKVGFGGFSQSIVYLQASLYSHSAGFNILVLTSSFSFSSKTEYC